MLMRTSPQISAGKYTTKSGIDLFGTIRAAKHYMHYCLSLPNRGFQVEPY